MLTGRRRRIAIVSTLAAVLAWAGPASAGPAAATWHEQTTPSPSDFATFSAVSCPTTTRCVAVGTAEDQLAESWNGTTWRVNRTGVAPPSASTAGLTSVSCPTTIFCVAVGSYLLDNGEGSQNHAFTEILNDGSWRLKAVPSLAGYLDSELSAVSCVSTHYCVAVGDGGPGDLLSEVWNGTSWRLLPAVQDTGAWPRFDGVSCYAVSQCTAVGANPLARRSLPLAERLSGSSWQLEHVPVATGSAHGASKLLAVSCPTATRCVAVGDSATNPSGIRQHTLVESWHAGRWRVERVPAPTGSTQSRLAGVSCVSATSCWAVGNSIGASAIQRVLAEVYNGTNWSRDPVAAPSGQVQTGLTGVSCVRRPVCTGVGSVDVLRAGNLLTLAERN